MRNKALASINVILLWWITIIVISFLLIYKHYRVCSLVEQTQQTVGQFISSQPDIAITILGPSFQEWKIRNRKLKTKE